MIPSPYWKGVLRAYVNRCVHIRQATSDTPTVVCV